MSSLEQQLHRQLHHLARRGFEVRELTFALPAHPREVQELEADLGLRLPPAFREVLLTVSAEVHYSWCAPDGLRFDPPFQSNFCGDLHWSIELTRQFDQDREDWIRTCFPDPSNPYDAVWHHKLAFYSVGDGDYLAMDLAADRYGQIVYLSHDDGEGHGHVLAHDFRDLLDRWVPLACVGGEDFQWLPFTNDLTSPLDPNGANGRKWREILGLAE